MSATSPWGPGHVIADKFRLVRRLGQGGMGSVWAADHLALNSQVAVKIIDAAIAQNEEALARFLREAQAAAQLRSPHVVQTFDYGVESGVPFIAMELLEGESLAQRLDRVKRVSPQETAKILTEVGRAMSRAHDAGIVHRDLKPDNIFLVRNDDDEIAKVLDFGIAKATNAALGNSSQTRTGAILGTPYYMSPEQAEGNRSVDHRTDLWSLAVIAFECVTGRKPFQSEALGDLILQICVKPIRKPSDFEQVPPAFDEWFAKAIQRDPAQRFQSARDLTTGLRLAAGLRPTETVRVATVPREGDAANPPALAESRLGHTSGQPLRDTGGERSLSTTGSAAAVTNTTYGPGTRMPTPVLVAATLGALAFAGTIAFFALRPSAHAEATATSANVSGPVNASAPSPPATPSTTAATPAEPSEPSLAKAEAPLPQPAGSTQKLEAAKVSAPIAGAHPLVRKGAPPRAPTPTPEKPAEKPASGSKHVDFGF